MATSDLSGFLTALALAAGIALAPAPASAQRAIDCEATELDAELLVCSQRDLAAAEEKLTDIAAKLSAQLPKAARAVFDKAQKNWVAYRDAECAWNAYDIELRETSELIRTTCMADLTAARAEELEAGIFMQ